MIIAIDGPAGVGKSSVARACALNFSLRYINSGLLYRIVSLQIIQYSDIIKNDMRSVIEYTNTSSPSALRDLYIQYTADEQLYAQCYSTTVDDCVGSISTVSEVREMINQAIALLEQGNDCIVEGRDIASVVHHDAELKIYLDAKIEARAKRRAKQRVADYSDVLRNIEERDEIDYKKKGWEIDY